MNRLEHRVVVEAVRWLGGLLIALVIVIGDGDARAAEKYQVGDEIEVLHLRQWRPGKVVQTNARGDVKADFEFGASTQQQVFKATDVRYAYEKDAIARTRTWSDPSGTFKIKAALLSLEDESVLLRKPDNTELKVPLAKLSTTDQDFVKRLRKELGPSANRPPQVPPPETFDESAAIDVWKTWGAAGQNAARPAITPDPLPAFVKLKQAGVAFPTQEFFDRLGAVLPLGGPNGWVLASIENHNPGESIPGRLLWVSLVKGKVENQQLLPHGEVVVDYHPQSKQLLTMSEEEGNSRGLLPNILTIWRVAPADTGVTLVARWKFNPGSFRGQDNWARIVDATTVVHRWKSGEIAAWDFSAKQLRYRLAQESFFQPAPTLSGGRRYLIVPEDRQVRILEAASGFLVCTLPAPEGSSATAMTEDGTRLAVLNRNQLVVWDLTSPDAEPEKYQAEAIGTPFTTTMEWVGSDQIMADNGHRGKVLFSLKHRIALWRYDFDLDAVPEQRERRVKHVLDGHLVYAASVGELRQKGLAVGAVELPGPKVREEAESLDPESLMILKPGVEVAVNLQCGEYNERVYAAVQQIAARNGWVLNQSASIVMLCEMKRGEQQNSTYRSFDNSQSQSVSFTPYISSMQLQDGKRVIWQAMTATGAPPVMSLTAGQTAQGEVDRWQLPNPEFFERLSVPAKLLDPDKRSGLGVTRVTNRGLIAK
ncbi:MAG: SHD1 domain-containing protein [Pirellulales bacterium]